MSDTMTSQDEMTVRALGVTKRFGDAQVLNSVDLEIRRGTVHGLVGANGSGKSTLIKILAGVYDNDAGQILCGEQHHSTLTPDDARDLGMRFIHQHPNLFPDLLVADNIAISANYANSGLIVKETKENAAAKAALSSIGVHDIDVRAPARSLSAAQQTLVAVARALQNIDVDSHQIRLLVLDEPTAALNAEEAEKIFSTVSKVKSRGISVLYVSHRLPEITQLCDEVTVLQDGQVLETLRDSRIDVDVLFQLISQKTSEADAKIQRTIAKSDQPERMQVKGLSCSPIVNATFTINVGEVIGVAGLLGSGRTEMLEAIAGGRERNEQSVFIDQKPVHSGSVATAVGAGIIYVPEDRRDAGSFQELTLGENLSLTIRTPIPSRFGWLSPAKIRQCASALITRYGILPAAPSKTFGLLSGGNQQKAVMARAIQEKPKVLLLDEPTQAVDVGAKLDIHEAIAELASAGTSVLFVSSDFSELLRICDRLMLVSRSGIEIISRTAEITEEELVRHVS